MGVKARPLTERLWRRVDVRGPGECWPWLGAILKGPKGGYGVIREGGRGSRLLYVHRVAWESQRGPIPEGMTIDHVRKRGCTLRCCCNPKHMEVVSLSENSRRGAEVRWREKGP